MHIKIFILSLIGSAILGTIMSQLSPEIIGGYSEADNIAYVGERLFLFVCVMIMLYLSVGLYKFLLRPLFKILIGDFKRKKNLFEKIFYSKILGPFISNETKDNISQDVRGRVLIIFYPIVYLSIVIPILGYAMGEFYDEEIIIIVILLILAIIPYKLLIFILVSTYKYILGK